MRNVHIKALDMELTDAISKYIKEKLSHLDKFIDPNDEDVECDVRVSQTTKHHVSGNIFKAELTLHTSGKNYGARAENENLYAAIDDLKDQVQRKMTTHKDKKLSLFKRGAIKIKEMLRRNH